MTENLHKLLFNPESIAVIGASNDKLKTGGRVTDNIKSNGYKGKLWAINPKTPSIMGLPTFRGIPDLPGVPDLAYIAIPAPYVRSTLEELAAIAPRRVQETASLHLVLDLLRQSRPSPVPQRPSCTDSLQPLRSNPLKYLFGLLCLHPHSHTCDFLSMHGQSPFYLQH